MCAWFIVAGWVSFAAAEEKPQTAIDVGGEKQLFIDKKFIESSRDITLVMNSPNKTGEVLIKADQPWETVEHPGAAQERGYMCSYSSIIKEGDRFRVWYDFLEYTGSGPFDHDRWVAYAESKDGVHFTKPVLNLHQVHGSTANNVVLPSTIGGCAVWIDPNAAPEHRYKTQTKVYPSGEFQMHSSPDGLHWKLFAKVDAGGGKDTQSIIFWDKYLSRYVFFGRHKKTTAEIGIRCRSVRRGELADATHIRNTGVALWPDAVDQAIYPTTAGNLPLDYYGATVFPYEEADHIYIMLAQTYWHWLPTDVPKGSLDPATLDVRLAVSRDGEHFSIAGDRKPFLRLGASGQFDSRWVWAMPKPVIVGDEIWVYYVGMNQNHNDDVDSASPDGRLQSGISRAVMRLDGFVSADAPCKGGELVTPAIRFAGKSLELNVDASAGGCVLVELLDAEGKPIEGFCAADASPVLGNSVRMPVTWGDKADVGRLAGKPIKIRFTMRDCKLYAFQFK